MDPLKNPDKFHPKQWCELTRCCLHNPSDHPLKTAPLWWRADRGIMERICAHGVGHPDPDGMAYARGKGSDDFGTHGCDGCCSKKTEEVAAWSTYQAARWNELQVERTLTEAQQKTNQAYQNWENLIRDRES